ncbi:MAG: permease, partial [Pseudomonadales bacterium]|nr:permease [Pseudomonadales bacterium]
MELFINELIEALGTLTVNFYSLSLESAPFLVLGLVIAGLIKAWVPTESVAKQLGGSGIWPITKAALIGAPLPLCSCSVIPVTLGIHRSGASKGSTVSFLVATPETGADSIAISYALLGPFMAIIRPISAISSAIFAGLIVSFSKDKREDELGTDNSREQAQKSCCSPDDHSTTTVEPVTPSVANKIIPKTCLLYTS